MDPCIRVAIADDSAAVRMSLRSMLKLDPRLTLVGEAKNGSANEGARNEEDLLHRDVRFTV